MSVQTIEKPQPSADYLLHLEADGCLQFINLLHNVVGVCEHCGELAGLTESRAEETRYLLDQTVRREESIITLGCGVQGEKWEKTLQTYFVTTV